MPSVQCPECRMELLPHDLVAQEDHILCGKCGGEIYIKKKSLVKLKCQKCDEVANKREPKSAEACRPDKTLLLCCAGHQILIGN